MKDPFKSYLATRAAGSPYHIEGESGTGFAGAVVIPALSESLRLFATLASLAANPPEELSRVLVLVVVNHREDATFEQKVDNHETLRRLRVEPFPLHLGVVDAASPGRELLARTGGVGLARKLGLDLALPRVERGGFLACLDADTLVEKGYLKALRAHFQISSAGGAVIPFRHQPGETVAEERAITLYELYLRHYVLGLKLAGSPYAFHTVGSAMACSARAYVRMGGMNSRAAGEDFYFLQQLKRTAGIEQVAGSCVHPSARSSWRVPFGTGKSISRLISEGEDALTFYRPECFTILKKWLHLAENAYGSEGGAILAESARIHPELARYLCDAGFLQVWDRLRKNCKTAPALQGAFHGWFDSLKTVRLMHHLSGSYPRCRPQEALPALFSEHGTTLPESEPAQLDLLRSIQAPIGPA